MSHWESDQDYEEPDEHPSYQLNFTHGANSVTVMCSQFPLDDIEFELSDPVLITALQSACENALKEHY